MATKQDIITQIESLQRANARAYALSDIAPLVQNYIEEINRQYQTAASQYEQLKKTGASESALHDALNKQYILKYQITETQSVRNTLAKQAVEALEALKVMQEEFRAFSEGYMLKE